MKHLFTFGIILLLPLLLSAQIAIQITPTNVSCFGGNNGTALASAAGGTAPYAFVWSNGEQTSAIASLSMGSYTVTVTDDSGMTASKSVFITQPPLLGATLNGQPQICSVAPDGFSYAIPTGGTPPCSFSWSNGTHTQLNNHLTANTYTVTVTDTRGCTTIGSFEVGYLGLGLYLFTNSEPATCPQPFNGSASVSALSGNGPYQYVWNTGDTTTKISHVTPGEYTVSVSDMNGCAASTSITVERDDIDSTSIQILLPQCTGAIYGFQSANNYDVYHWTVNDVRDTIVAGEGTSEVQIKWGAPGQKELSVAMSDTVTQCATSTSFKVTVYLCTTGSTTASGLEQLQITPNPFSRYIGIHGNEIALQGAEAQLYNLEGVLVARQLLTGTSTLMDTQALCPGLYWLKVSDGRNSKVMKVVKE